MCQQWGPPKGNQGGKPPVLGVFIAAALVVALLTMTGAVKQHPAFEAFNQEGGGNALAGIFGGFLKDSSKQFPKLFKPKDWKRNHKGTAKVPHGLSFTNGAGCRPKGDWSRVDSRVRTVLVKAAKRYAIRVSCLHTGHSTYVRGTRRVSNHTAWRAVDIDRVNGRPVRYSNRAARNLALLFGHGRLGAQPSEVGSPWFTAGIFFTDSGHKNHLHVGFRGR